VGNGSSVFLLHGKAEGLLEKAKLNTCKSQAKGVSVAREGTATEEKAKEEKKERGRRPANRQGSGPRAKLPTRRNVLYHEKKR